MKIKKIINLCKSSRSLTIYTDLATDMQWLSDGQALFPLYGLPLFDIDSFCNTYDINDNLKSKMNMRILEELPAGFDFNDSNNFETEVEKMPMSLNYADFNVLALKTETGIKFIERKYLSLFSDYCNSDLTIFERTGNAGHDYIVVKNGFNIIGIILPVELLNRSFLDEAKTFVTQLEMTLDNIF